MKSLLYRVLLHVTTSRGLPIEAAALGYLLTSTPARPVRAVEEPPPGILRRLSAAPKESAAVPVDVPPAAPLPAVAARARRTPPRPWV